jgi:hypothetical protein
MAVYGADQTRLFVLDSSRDNGAYLGKFKQGNNRYVCTLMLFDHDPERQIK